MQSIHRGAGILLFASALFLPSDMLHASDPPAAFQAVVSTTSDSVTVDYEAHPIRSANFEVIVQQSDGSFQTAAAPASRIYIGEVQGHPGAMAAGLLKENGTLITRVYFENGVEWSSTGGTATIRGGTNWTPQWPTTEVASGGAGSVVYEAEVGVDSPYHQFQAVNSSVTDTLEIAEFSVMASNLAFIRDMAVVHTLGKVVIRASQAHCPYEQHGGNTNGLLTEIRSQWEQWSDNPPPVGNTHDLALVARPGAGGGLAWVGSIGTSIRYSSNGSAANGDFSIIWRHEAGHNWGSGHYEGGGNPEGPTIMSNNQISRFSSSELERMLAHRNTRLHLFNNLGAYPVPVPPRANQVRAHCVPGQTVTIDVLDNDSDSNGGTLAIDSFDSVSVQGAPVSLSAGTGPGGRDELVYSAAPDFVDGTDWFTYRIINSEGRKATGYVMVRPGFEEDLLAHWTFDEGSGGTAADTTPAQRTGTLQGGASWTTGVSGNAVTLNGTDAHVAAPPLGISTNTLTYAGWIRPDGPPNDWAGIAFSRGGGVTAGLNFGSGGELRYHWGAGSNPSWTWNSGLVPPQDAWTFVAWVVSPGSATIYMKPEGGSLQSATATGTFDPVLFTPNLQLGWDTHSQPRRFRGDIDEFRVFRRSLDASEIASLAAESGTPSAPSPGLGEEWYIADPLVLEWTPAAGSTSWQVYLGSSYADVRDATTASPEYLGSTSSPSFAIPQASEGGIRFWRVDSLDGVTTFSGPVWHFRITEELPGLVAWWKANEGSGTVAADSGPAGADASLNNVTWADGRRGGAMEFHGDGVASAGTAASLGGGTPFTVSAWVRIPPSHSSLAVLVQQRSTSEFPGGGYNGQYVLRVNGDGRPSFWVYGNFATQWDFAANTAIHDDQWHHITAVRDGTEGYIYINGVLDGSASGTVRDLNAGIPVHMGSDFRDSNRHLTGRLDQVRIFNRALSPAQVLENMNRAPFFTSDPISAPPAEEGVSYTASIADKAADLDSAAGEELAFSKVSGPSWLDVAADGSLSGTPPFGSAGTNTWTVAVTDSFGAQDTAQLIVDVDAGVEPNEAPEFTSDPVVKADATVGEPYAASLSGDAVDPDGDPLVFSKDSGPTWLDVAANGALSGTPGASDEGTNQWTVRATDPGGASDTTTLRIDVLAAPTSPVAYGPVAQSTTYGSVQSGTLGDVLESNNSYLVLLEERTGGRPNTRISRLEHTFTFDIGAGGDQVDLEVEAHHDPNSEDDHFVFSWSEDGSAFTDVITVTKTADDDQAQVATLPPGLSGTVWIRVVDTDRTPGNSSQEQLYIDRLNLIVQP